MNVRVLEQWFATGLTREAGAWFSDATSKVRAAGVASDVFAVAWSGAGRRLGRQAVQAADAEAASLRASAAPFVPGPPWCADEVGRALLLLAAAETDGAARAFAAAVGELFRKGEMREQQALLRVLPFLPDPRQYADIATDAVRSNAVSVLEAIACDNTFPADHLSDLAFNQLVMKAIFNQVPLARVVGLPSRNNDELRRMVTAYARERQAAGRPVPGDVDLITQGVIDP